jgi:hypothetical protein
MDFHSAAARGLRRYVRLVTAALGPNVDCVAVHWNHPANAYLALTGRLHWFPGRTLALTWDSRHGWAMVLASCASGCSATSSPARNNRPRRVAPTTWPSASPATPHRAGPAAVLAAGFTSTV